MLTLAKKICRLTRDLSLKLDITVRHIEAMREGHNGSMNDDGESGDDETGVLTIYHEMRCLQSQDFL